MLVYLMTNTAETFFMWEMIVGFVDVSVINDHRCLNSP
jgi:hypothetical protein